MKKTSLLLALALAGWMSTASAHGNGGNGSLSGTFTSSDGTTGTYVETKTTVGDVTTDTIALTDTDTATTGSYTVTTTVNADGTRTVVYADLALGATVPTVLSLTLPAVTTSTTTETICGNASVSLYATGTLTSAAGLLDTLNAFVTLAGGDTVASLDFSTTLIGLARELFVVSNNGPSKVITTIDVSLAGVATTTKLTLTATGSMHHHMH